MAGKIVCNRSYANSLRCSNGSTVSGRTRLDDVAGPDAHVDGRGRRAVRSRAATHGRSPRLTQLRGGGGHWGGGLVINTLDHARFGYLILRGGAWDGRAILDPGWIDALAEPCRLNAHYGYMWWLNSDGNQCPDAAHSCFYAAGAGGNIIWIDRSNDLVIVCRWAAKDKIGELLGKFTRAVVA